MSSPQSDRTLLLGDAARAAARCRASWLSRVRITDPATGKIVDDLLEAELSRAGAVPMPSRPEPATVADVLDASGTRENRALLRLNLIMLLRHQPGWGPLRAEGVVGHVLSVTGVRLDRRHVTVGWLLDPRAGGRRYTAWLDALEPKKDPPWSGFPHTRSLQR